MDTPTSVRQVACAPVPPPAPLEMPTQALRGVVRTRRSRASWRTVGARLVAFGGAVLLTWHAARTMVVAVSLGQTSWLQYLLVGVFTLTFAWIAFSAAAALAGLLATLFPGRRTEPGPDAPLPARTALLMPVYNEDPAPTSAALAAMAEGLIALGHGDDFELFLASDTTDPEAWVRETAAFQELRSSLEGRMKVWYRRRYRNVGRKAGNVREFIERFGGRYEALVVLDADSLIEPDALVRMARELRADEGLGLLQTVPQLIGGTGLYARMQQFASALYGPPIARGVSAWQGVEGNFWGHNAILRTRAFAASCGLPTLTGRPPFGGHVLSHDFVEAAFLVRAGWRVRMDPDIEGSFEAGPPTLLDTATRDRRWAQGNLQHAGLIGAAGLAPISRAHFSLGISSYLASPLWLLLIATGVALAVVARWTDPVYFGQPRQLYPDWPRFDTARMVYLFVLSLVVLLLPKLMGIAQALGHRAKRSRFGGGGRVVLGAILELALSSLYAPIMMLMQSRQIVEILLGRDSGWSAQRRDEGRTPWSVARRRHAGHTLVGLALTALLFWASPTLLAWMAPTLLGLVGAIWLSRASGSRAAGDWFARRGLLATPADTSPPAVVQARDACLGRFRAASAVTLRDLATDLHRREAHFASVEPLPPVARGDVDPDRLTSEAKAKDARSLDEALSWMTPREQLVLLTERGWLEPLSEVPRPVRTPASV